MFAYRVRNVIFLLPKAQHSGKFKRLFLETKEDCFVCIASRNIIWMEERRLSGKNKFIPRVR